MKSSQERTPKNMDAWRLIPLQTHNASMNMAIDEAILTSRTQNHVPNTLRFYQWQPSAVSIGKNQNPHETLYMDALKKLGVDLVRRTSGGGTVYHDQTGEITYSLTARAHDLGKDIPAVYTSSYAAIIDALRLLGIPADFNTGDRKNCPNLTVQNKKISGSAQTLKHGIIQQHGTILLNVDLPRMFQLLRVPFTDDCNFAAQAATRKITSIQHELGHAVSPETVQNALAQGFRAILKIQLTSSKLTPYEQALAQKLCTGKYATSSWNHKGIITPSFPNAT
jgi:lipoate-protein ligase A